MDINDNRPVCPPTEDRQIQVRLDTPINATIFQFTATDVDLGKNSLLIYTLEGFDQELKFFMIDSATGELTIISLLPSSNRNLRITLNVSDSGDRPLSTDCDVLVTFYQFNNTVDIVLNTTADQFDKEMFENVLTEILEIPSIVVNVTVLDDGLVIILHLFCELGIGFQSS